MTVIGIDLGTTNSCAAVLAGERPDIIANAEGDRLTPSVVAIGGGGERLIGHAAKRQAIVNPSNTIYSIKRFIGCPYDAGDVQSMLPRMPFQCVPADRGGVAFQVGDGRHSPEELSGLLLEKLRRETEERLETNVDRAVITVPAYFDDRQRTATRDAGRIAGLEVLQILNEPTAAAIAYGLQRRRDRVLAVYDLGGGTFDVSILEQRGGDFRVLATAGDSRLGGDDFDDALMTWMIDRFEHGSGAELPAESTVIQRLKNAAEAAKRDLSSAQVTRISIPFIAAGASGPLHLELEILRAQFEELVSALVDRTLEPCRRALEDAGLEPGDVDDVLLVGGQTRSRIVHERVTGFFGRKPLKEIHPDEAVALGAAIAAGITTGQIEEATLRDVTPLSLGIEVRGDRFRSVVPRNTPIPARATHVVTTTEDHQMLIRVHVLQGEQDVASRNRTLGIFGLGDFQPGPKGRPRIEIAFEVDANGIVHVGARDLASGASESVRITDAGEGLTEAEIERLMRRAEARREAEDDRERRIALENELTELVHAARRALIDQRLDEDGRRDLEEASDAAAQLVRSEAEPEVLEEAIASLRQALGRD